MLVAVGVLVDVGVNVGVLVDVAVDVGVEVAVDFWVAVLVGVAVAAIAVNKLAWFIQKIMMTNSVITIPKPIPKKILTACLLIVGNNKDVSAKQRLNIGALRDQPRNAPTKTLRYPVDIFFNPTVAVSHINLNLPVDRAFQFKQPALVGAIGVHIPHRPLTITIGHKRNLAPIG